MSSNLPEYYTVAEVAVKLHRTEYHIRRLIRQGRLGATKPRDGRGWLIPSESLDDYMKVVR